MAGSASRERLAACLYAGCLGRPSTAQELSGAVTALDGGLEPCDLALRLFQSPEFLSTSRFVALLYPALLQRAPEYLTWEIYRNAIVTGRVTREQMVQNFLSSVEHAIQFRTRSDEEFIGMLYGALLVRRPIPQEIEECRRILQSATSRAAVVERLLDRAELTNGPAHYITAFLLYATLLQRESAANERVLRAEQVREGTPLRRVIADILNSREFAGLAGLDGDQAVDPAKPPLALRALHYVRSKYRVRAGP